MTSILIVWAAASAYMFVIMFVLPSLEQQQQKRPKTASRKLTTPAVTSRNNAHATA